MAVSKVILNGEVLMDTTVDTVTSSNLLSSYQATGADGKKVIGAYVPTTPIPTPKQWERPSDWPDLSKMDVSGGDILYMTSYADEARGFCSFYCTCTGQYTVEVGTISGSTFTAESTQSYDSNNYCELYYGSTNGTYKVLRVTGTTITKLNFRSSAITINNFNAYSSNQGIIDIVGKLPSGTSLSFSNQYNLVNVDIDGLVFNAGVNSMFTNCYSLASVNTSSWNTSNVTSMNNMFSYCYSLTSLDISGFNTSNVTNMSGMFQTCSSLTSLDISRFNTSNVTNMSGMFSNCYSLTSLDVSGFNTSNVTSMGSMFQNCYSLTSLDVSGFNTSNVISMSGMFSGCYSLTSVDVSGFNTSNVTSMGSMFNYCASLTEINVSGFNTGNVTSMNYVFSYCYSLTSLDVSDWNTSNVTSMISMFSNCYALKSLDVSSWNTSNVMGMGYMFQNCYSLTSLDVSGFDTSKVTSMISMFSNCYALKSLDISGFDFSKVTSASNFQSFMYYATGIRGSITLPATITVIGANCFAGMRSIYEWHFLSTTPPTLANTNAFNNMTDFGGKKIYVPSASLSAYQTASNWSTYASYMVGE